MRLRGETCPKGTYATLWETRTVRSYPAILISSVALTLVVAFALWGLPAWTLFPPALISGLTGGSPGALVRARWNNVITKPEQLHTAYALESTLDELTFVIGPVAATALSTSMEPNTHPMSMF